MKYFIVLLMCFVFMGPVAVMAEEPAEPEPVEEPVEGEGEGDEE